MLLIAAVSFVLFSSNASGNEEGCILPQQPLGGSFEVLDCRPGDRSAKCRKVPGTEVDSFTALLYSCDDWVISSEQEKTTYCNLSGKWIPDISQLPRCRGNNLRNKGNLESEYTWHASVYKKVKHKLSLLCSGIILSERAVITAAHCVYNQTGNTVIPTDDLWVVVGKFHKSWDIDPNEQRLKVLEIVIRDTFLGIENRFEHDIAVLFLAAEIIIKPTVMPVCIDREHSFPVKKLSNGTVLGWGRTESGASDTLRVAMMQFYDFHTCREHVSSTFVLYITYDKFCARSHNGTNSEPFLSGAGLTFSHVTADNKEIHCLHGVVSVGDPNDNTLIGFTNVTIHLPWLDRVVKDMEKRRKKTL